MTTDQHRPALWFGALSGATDEEHRHRALESGEGCFVRDVTGRRYLDARSALWNAALGYDNARVRAAIHRQLDALPVAQLIRHEQPTALALAYARRLVAALPGDLAHVRFCTTGAQAVEGAVMLSRFIRRHEGHPERTGVIALWDGYHGVGGLASGLTGEAPLHRLQEPLATGVRHVPPGDADALRDAVASLGPQRVTAILLEPVLGTGVVELCADYLRAARELCDRHGIHLIFDEVSTGFGRTGSLTAAERLGVDPDMMLLSKGITAGYAPLAAIAVTGAVLSSALAAGVVFPHGSTSDGHPLALAAADAVLDEFAEGAVLRNVVERGAQLTAALRELGRRLPAVRAVHGPGLMVAVTLADDAGEPFDAAVMTAVKQACLRHGLLVSLCGSLVLLTPPLVITDGEVDLLVELFERGLREAVEQSSGQVGGRLLAHS
ncbi:aspartate aminotransferase family protein [Micromonospora sp. KLBMP9576]|uniref:aminotransferase family protein n=1 Tax=Micromonospora sp. KLBMP9576 TaxID=3424769 RepID=UPI003D93F80D